MKIWHEKLCMKNIIFLLEYIEAQSHVVDNNESIKKCIKTRDLFVHTKCSSSSSGG